jgi:DNA-directed RNA polymerase subunit RPC12/RpoP
MPEKSEREKTGRTFDSAYGFSFSIAVGLILFIAGLVISLTLSDGTSIGLIFGIPLLIAGLIIPVFMMRDLFKSNEINAPCPNCGAPIRTSDATLRLKCTACQSVIDVREKELILASEQIT